MPMPPPGEQTRAVLDRLENDVDLYLLYQSGAEDTQLLQLLNRYAVLRRPRDRQGD